MFWVPPPPPPTHTQKYLLRHGSAPIFEDTLYVCLPSRQWTAVFSHRNVFPQIECNKRFVFFRHVIINLGRRFHNMNICTAPMLISDESKGKKKVKLPLCLINWEPRHEDMEEWRYRFTILELATGWSWVASFMPQPLKPLGKGAWYPLDRRLGGSQR
jgi:hypothetical protein